VVELHDGVYWVGVKDWNLRLFDALIPTPQGTSYNAYLVLGENKKALIDTVFRDFSSELEEKIRQVVDPNDLDYVIMNHAEPDHASAIPHMMEISPKAKFVMTGKGAKMAQVFYRIPEDRIEAVADQETIDLGGKTLQFIEAPMLHWPETMFTYLKDDGILFPCDFFGAHTAKGTFDDEVDDLIPLAKKYFGEIMMPFRPMAKRGLDKIANLKIDMIAPSHGPVYRNPEKILAQYRKWANGETERKATIAYVTMWGSTESMANMLAETLASEGVEVVLHNLAITDLGDLAADLVDSKAIVLGSPTVLAGAHPLAFYASYLAKALKPPARLAAVVSSYGWGGGAVKQIAETVGPLGMEVVGAVDINGPPSENDIKQIVELGKKLANRIREG
jgi:flavorubredoxin